MIIIDQLDDSVNEYSEVICWRSYERGGNVISIPAYLEEHAERLRNKYLSFIYELGETIIDGKNIISHMNIDGDFSLWWMSHLAEKSPFKSHRIYDCLRLIALDEILGDRKPANLHLVNNDKAVMKSISILCENLKINLTCKKNNLTTKNLTLYNLYSLLPYVLQGLLSLRHIISRWTLCKLSKPKWFSGTKSICMCSYFYHMDTVAADEGEFYSRQWENLPKSLHDNGFKTNWIHHFITSPGMPDSQGGVKWFERFNKNAEKQGSHTFLETYLSYRIVFKVIINWLKLILVAWRLKSIKKAFIPKNTSIDLWPLLINEWKTSIIGPIAINNCLWVELFNSALKSMPYQEKGLYLWENQGWETALVYAWKKNGHGRIIGVPHSTVRFWALGNYDDVRILQSKDYLSKPLPDYLAVNGPMAWNEFIKASYPTERLVEVEAMRYQYLLSYRSSQSEKELQKKLPPTSENGDSPVRMLIIGDYAIEQTYKMLRCVERAQTLLDKTVMLTVKPHPACKVEQKDFPNLKFTITYKPLAGIISNFDMAFSSNTTSGGLDALLAGLFVVIFLDENDFNYSPLRGIEDVEYISTANDLALALGKGISKTSPPIVDEIFWLDNNFPKWKKLLEMSVR